MSDKIVNIIEGIIHDDGIGVDHDNCQRTAWAIVNGLRERGIFFGQVVIDRGDGE